MPDPRLLTRLNAARIVTTEAALDAATLPADTMVLRFAPDEALVVAHNASPTDGIELDDEHAILVADSGWFGAWVPESQASSFLDAECAWPRPTARPAFAQGMVAHLPVKVWFETDQTMIVVPHVSAHELENRMRSAGVTDAATPTPGGAS